MTFLAIHDVVAGTLLAVAESDAPAEPSDVGIGAVVLAIAVSAFLAWMGYLVISSRRRTAAAPEETPKNLQPYLSDDELESKRVTRVLSAAVVASAVLAVALPVYYVNESNRQEAAAHAFEERDVEEGGHWYTKFTCNECHGPDGGGGGAEYIEKRSGVETSWAAPSINDVFFRYSEEEVLYWLRFGRQGTPMPAAGLEGGGQMTEQELDQLIAYLHSIEIPQTAVLAEIEGTVQQALARIASGTERVESKIAEQEAAIDDILMAPEWFAVMEPIPAAIDQALAGPGSCTSRSAAIIGASCSSPGVDSDRDGLSDAAELELNRLGALLLEGVPTRSVTTLELVPDELFELQLDPTDAFSMEAASGEPLPDLASVEAFLNHVETRDLNLRVTAERQDRFLGSANEGLDFLQDALAAEKWIPDGVSVVPGAAEGDSPTLDASDLAAVMGVSSDQALRAVGLYNGYCARCHTGGYQAGAPFEQPPGSGAWGPALWDGRSVGQFPDAADQISFIVRGSNANEPYGVNGLGRGWMPGFGQILTQEDIELIVAYERTL